MSDLTDEQLAWLEKVSSTERKFMVVPTSVLRSAAQEIRRRRDETPLLAAP